ncbi:dNTP triphosphohydrolase [Cnuibacter physcomitrellae]|uniref:deoxyguanosinetriphosphate triphosphohydrolase family protein n=1 Tax=Cnuibacter physcomitrellae TaxID=1619308 RepID=UPI00217587D4|nr:dNTP triphosphohydrolase [Cnuibacter physcomitrellae]MCS5497984.1 dNTP triphosphohydrolase [Cnuibacter physcomitrellae]
MDTATEDEAFLRDVQRIQFSPFFSRLADVTQVVSPASPGSPVHNRLTHSLKVSAIAQGIARRLADEHGVTVPSRVVQAASCAHDVGHPPFGHLGERVLDRLARHELGLPDGFEGNAQTYRILTALAVTGGVDRGLGLTGQTRAAVAKYPWSPLIAQDPAALPDDEIPKGLQHRGGAWQVPKYSCYVIDEPDLIAARDEVGAEPLRQTLAASVMDIADDIAYSVHDLEDFYRSGILSYAEVALEFNTFVEDAHELVDAELPSTTAAGADDLPPGGALEKLRRKIRRKDGWVYDADIFYDSVVQVRDELVDGLLARPFDASLAAEHATAEFTDRWITRLGSGIVPTPVDTLRAGPVTLDARTWHLVEVLKFVHKRFVLSRTDLAVYQRGLSEVLQRSVRSLVEWTDDRLDASRVPRRLRDLIAIAEEQYSQRAIHVPQGSAPIAQQARARAVLDYVSSFTDTQALAFAEAISGRSDRLWSLGRAL